MTSTEIDEVLELAKKHGSLRVVEKIIKMRERMISMREENLNLKKERSELEQDILMFVK